MDDADARGEIVNEIVITPFANPLGLSQTMLGNHQGRFNFASGVNYNRGWMNVFDGVCKRIDGSLTTDEAANTTVIRSAIYAEIEAFSTFKEDEDLKKILFRVAAVSVIVLDLHCDCDALIHMYAHDRLWPKMADLAACLGTEIQMVASDSGCACFDEACSTVWEKLQDKYPGFPIAMACEAVTIELRGFLDVSNEEKIMCIPCLM